MEENHPTEEQEIEEESHSVEKQEIEEENHPVEDQEIEESASKLPKEEVVEEKSRLEKNAKKMEEIAMNEIPTEPTKSGFNLFQKKWFLLVLGVMIILMVTAVILLVSVLNKGKDHSKDSSTQESSNVEEELPKEEIDANGLVLEYGAKVEEYIQTYQKEEGKFPTVEDALANVTLENHDIQCATLDIHEDGKIYLEGCTVDGSLDSYSYGTKEEVKGKTLDIYKGKNQYGVIYNFESFDKASKVGTVTCQTDHCEGVVAYNQYAIVEEDGLAVYDYQNNTLVFQLNEKEYDQYITIGSDETFYGFYYQLGDENTLYSISSRKKIHQVAGQWCESGPDDGLYLGMNKGYVYFITGNSTSVFDMKSGSLVTSLTGKLYDIQSVDDVTLYYLTIDNSEKTRVYQEDGTAMFQGKSFDSFYVVKGNYITVENNAFTVYGTNQKSIYTSKNYDKVSAVYADYVVVLEGTNLELIDYNGNIVHTFITDWKEDQYHFHPMLSGWYTDNGKNGIYLVIEDNQVTKEEVLQQYPDMTKEELSEYDLGYEYYYIPTTKETGKLPTYIGGYAKPVLYLYPTMPMMIRVQFQNPNSLTTTYPKYEDCWNVFAKPNGDLYTLDSKYYYALYWEEQANHSVDFREGFYVTKESAIPFLEEKLTMIGLNDRERNEFIMYWLPVLEQNEQSLVYFELTREREFYSPLLISPKPTSLLRISMHVKKVDGYTPIRPQQFLKFDRKGFTAVEWGGVRY